MGIPDKKLDRMGDYYVTQQIGDRYNITFEQFLTLLEKNLWEDFKATQQVIKCVGCDS